MATTPELPSTKFWCFAIILCWLPGFNLLIFGPLLLFSKNPIKRGFYKTNIFLFLFLILLHVIAIAGLILVKGVDEIPKFWEEVQPSESDEPILVKPKVNRL